MEKDTLETVESKKQNILTKTLSKLNRSKRLKQLLMIVFSFVFIYAPPIIPGLNIVLIFGVLSMPYILIFRRKQLWHTIKNVKEELVLYIVAYLYIIMMIGLHYLKNGMLIYDIKNVYRFALIIPIAVSVAFAFVDILKRSGFSKKELFESMLIAANIQGLIGIVMVIFPPIKRQIVDLLYSLTSDPVYLQEWQYERRFFGYSNQLLDTFGLGQAILLSLATLMGTYYNKRFFLYLPLILASTFLNSRTGLVLYAFFVGLIVLMNLRRIIRYICSLRPKTIVEALKKANIIKLVIIAAVIIGGIVFSILAFIKLQGLIGKTIGWVLDGFISIYHLLTNQKAGDSVGVLFHPSWWQLPEGLNVIFGTGHTSYEYKEMVHTDVGYINDVWLGGIIGATMLYSAFIVTILRFNNIEKSKINLSFTIMLLVFFLLFNIKAPMITFNGGTAIMFILYFATVIYSQKGIINPEIEKDKNNITEIKEDKEIIEKEKI